MAHEATVAGLLCLSLTAGCAMQPPQSDPAVMENLAELQIRIRLLQTELSGLRATLAERQAQQARRATTDIVVQQRLDELQSRLTMLPEELRGLCPDPVQAATVTAQCEPSPEANRVVVSGDKLVVGEVERVWMDPPGAFLDARMAAGAETSSLLALNLVEFERDGSKWVRFDTTLEGEQTVSVERSLKRYVRGASGDGERRPAVELRVQLGDVREQVEVILVDSAKAGQTLVLGRNFLTDVALVDVARQHVQPAFQAPQ